MGYRPLAFTPQLTEEAFCLLDRLGVHTAEIFFNFPAEFVTGMCRVLNDDVAFVLDIKQAVRAEVDPLDMLDAMGPCLRHVHLNDHTLEQTCLPPGKGSFDFKGLFDRLQAQGFDGAGVIEVYRNDFEKPEELTASLHRLQAIL